MESSEKKMDKFLFSFKIFLQSFSVFIAIQIKIPKWKQTSKETRQNIIYWPEIKYAQALHTLQQSSYKLFASKFVLYSSSSRKSGINSSQH